MPESKDQGTEFEFTVVQKLNQSRLRRETQERGVIFPGCLFLFLFWTSKKEKIKSLKISCYLIVSIRNLIVQHVKN
jgi:hypothetical protein